MVRFRPRNKRRGAPIETPAGACAPQNGLVGLASGLPAGLGRKQNKTRKHSDSLNGAQCGCRSRHKCAAQIQISISFLAFSNKPSLRFSVYASHLRQLRSKSSSECDIIQGSIDIYKSVEVQPKRPVPDFLVRKEQFAPLMC